jgi:hypothetical protein
MRAASDPAQTARVLVARNPQNSSAASREASATTTIAVRPFDELARFSARTAHEQEIDLVQLQSEAISKSSAHLSQVRICFQVRGDYADTHTRGCVPMVLVTASTRLPRLTALCWIRPWPLRPVFLVSGHMNQVIQTRSMRAKFSAKKLQR